MMKHQQHLSCMHFRHETTFTRQLTMKARTLQASAAACRGWQGSWPACWTRAQTVLQVQTMFHEMGHGVNSVLCRNRLQHLFGARGALDVVEIPSHVLERIARSPQVIAALLGGSETAIDSSGKKLLPGYAGRAGEPPSGVTPRGGTELAAPNASKAPASAERTLRAAEVAQRHCEHLGVLDGLVMPRLDCALHGPNPPKSVRELRALVHGITEEVMGYEVPPETYARLSIHHLVTYGGMCHAYPYAEAIAELVWERHLRRDLRDGAAGRELAAAVLEPGGAVDAAEALEKLCPGIVESVAGGFCPVVA